MSDSVRLRSDGDSIVSKTGATVAFTRLTCQTQPLHRAKLFFGGTPTANTSSTQPVPDSRAPHGRSVEYFFLRVIRKKTVVGKQNAYGYASQEPLLLLSVGGSPAHPLRCWYIAPAENSGSDILTQIFFLDKVLTKFLLFTPNNRNSPVEERPVACSPFVRRSCQSLRSRKACDP